MNSVRSGVTFLVLCLLLASLASYGFSQNLPQLKPVTPPATEQAPLPSKRLVPIASGGTATIPKIPLLWPRVQLPPSVRNSLVRPGVQGAMQGRVAAQPLEGVTASNPNPVFLTAPSYASGGAYAHSVTTGDFNGDGKSDLVVANQCVSSSNCASGSLSVLLGNGDGTFQSAVSYASAGVYAVSVAVADVNRDGNLDLVVANQCASTSNCANGSVSVLLGNGDGTFQSALSYVSGGYEVSSLAVGDFNGDGKPDLVVANQCVSSSNCASGSLSVLLGNGDGTFQSAMSYASGGVYAVSVAVANVNGDGNLDLVAANGCMSSGDCANGGLVSVLLGNGDGTFQAAVSYASGGYEAVCVAVGDFNGDGKTDLAVTNFAGGTDLLLGSASGIAAGSVNRDGKPELVESAGRVVALFNIGSGLHYATSTNVNSSANPSKFGQSVTFTATVTPSGSGTPTGSVTFTDGSDTLGTAALGGGMATLTPPMLRVGSHSITAAYSGDSDFSASTSTAHAQTVNQAAGIVTLASSTNTSTDGASAVPIGDPPLNSTCGTNYQSTTGVTAVTYPLGLYDSGSGTHCTDTPTTNLASALSTATSNVTPRDTNGNACSTSGCKTILVGTGMSAALGEFGAFTAAARGSGLMNSHVYLSNQSVSNNDLDTWTEWRTGVQPVPCTLSGNYCASNGLANPPANFGDKICNGLSSHGYSCNQIQAMWVDQANGTGVWYLRGCVSSGSGSTTVYYICPPVDGAHQINDPTQCVSGVFNNSCSGTKDLIDATNVLGALGQMMRGAKSRMPNLQLAFFSSRAYAGYCSGRCANPEPFAYEVGLAIRALIMAQACELGDLGCTAGTIDPVAGDVCPSSGGCGGSSTASIAPALSWADVQAVASDDATLHSAYLWAKGGNARAEDSLVWCDGQSGAPCNGEVDFETDGVHLNSTGLTKAGGSNYATWPNGGILAFFLHSPYTKPWFHK